MGTSCSQIFLYYHYSFSLYNLLPTFIRLWLGESYILSPTVLICVLSIFSLNTIRGTTDQFISGYGLYHDIWAPATETVIYIVVALLGGYLWQLEGVLLGSIVSLIIVVYFWKPYFLFSRGFKITVGVYWKEFAKFCFISAFTFIIFETIVKPLYTYPIDKNWETFLLYSLFVCMSLAMLQFCLLYIGSRGMKNVVKRFIK